MESKIDSIDRSSINLKPIRCSVCGKEFIPYSPLQDCCPECSIELCSFEYPLDLTDEDFDPFNIFEF